MTSGYSLPRIEEISAKELRDLFNRQVYPRVLAGKLSEVVLEENEPTPPLSFEPPGTKSQLIGYFEGGRKVAVAHQYLRPDDSIGASGQPDPKWVRIDDVIYVLDIEQILRSPP